ncbi:hypothetical protein DWF04_006105 [Cereibacter sphaeroides f. sp. denitrificans]
MREMMPGGWSIEDDLVPNRERVKDLAKGDDAAVRAVAQLLRVELDGPKCGQCHVSGPEVAKPATTLSANGVHCVVRPAPDIEDTAADLVTWAHFVPFGGRATLQGGTVIERILPGMEGATVYYVPPEPARDVGADPKRAFEAEVIAEARSIIAGLLSAFSADDPGRRASLTARAANFLAPV